MANEDVENDRFAVWGVRKADGTPLIQTDMTFRRMMDEIIVPFNTAEMFFLDGAAI